MTKRNLYKSVLAVFMLAAVWAGVSFWGSSPASRTTGTMADAISQRVFLIAGDDQYSASVSRQTTVYGLMASLASTTSFTYKAKRYPDLGYFVEEINGVENAGGAYWTLYINGAYSTVGASQYELSDGDIVEWKYEKK